MQAQSIFPARRTRFILLASLFYIGFGIAAILWRLIAGASSPLAFNPHRSHFAAEATLLSAALVLNILFDLYAHRLFPSARALFRSLGSAVGRIGVADAALLAAASALGEELLFRGAVQPSLGLPAATLLFALSHFPLRRELILWPIYALAIGLVLGYLRILGGDIWSAVLLHFSVNFFGLLHLSRLFGSPRLSGKERYGSPDKEDGNGAADRELDYGGGHSPGKDTEGRRERTGALTEGQELPGESADKSADKGSEGRK